MAPPCVICYVHTHCYLWQCTTHASQINYYFFVCFFSVPVSPLLPQNQKTGVAGRRGSERPQGHPRRNHVLGQSGVCPHVSWIVSVHMGMYLCTLYPHHWWLYSALLCWQDCSEPVLSVRASAFRSHELVAVARGRGCSSHQGGVTDFFF